MDPSAPNWEFLTSAPNLVVAHALVDSLTAYGIPCQIASGPSLLGECQDCYIVVEAEFLHRAKWFMAQGTFTDEELTFLATGNLTSDDARKR
jgi:hypothetical protein